MHLRHIWLVTHSKKGKQVERVCISKGCGYLQRKSRICPGWTEHDLDESTERSFEVQRLVKQGKWDDSMLKPDDHTYTDGAFKELVLIIVLAPSLVASLSVLKHLGIISPFLGGGMNEEAALLLVFVFVVFIGIMGMGAGSAMRGQGAFNEDIL